MIVFIDWQIVMSWFWLACGGGGGVVRVRVRDQSSICTRARHGAAGARALSLARRRLLQPDSFGYVLMTPMPQGSSRRLARALEAWKAGCSCMQRAAASSSHISHAMQPCFS